MLLIDVNVLVYGYREDAPHHASYRRWLEGCVGSDEPYGMADLVLSGFLRVVTHPRIFSPPSPLESALRFARELRSQSNCVAVAPGPRHWEIFVRLCGVAGVKGNLVADAYLAALAVESGSEWITTDRDFSRFPGLRWRHPLS
jgi:toxin-antitoxin system PIN domain toxin